MLGSLAKSKFDKAHRMGRQAYEDGLPNNANPFPVEMGSVFTGSTVGLTSGAGRSGELTQVNNTSR